MGAVIQVREADAVLAGVPREVRMAIRRKLRYRPADYLFQPAYKHRRWDGWIWLMDEDGLFPPGLVTMVKELLHRQKIPVVVDMAARQNEGAALDLSINPEVQERWYQLEAVKAAFDAGSGVVHAPTGSGKSVIAAELIQKVGRNVVVLVPTLDLLFQTRSFLQWALDRPVGMLGGGVIEPDDITVATNRTMANILETPYVKYALMDFDDQDEGTEGIDPRAMKAWVDSIGLLIVDECHVVAADTCYNIARSLRCARKIGLSASPWRDDNADLKIEAALGPLVYRVGVAEVVRDGFLVPPLFSSWPTVGRLTGIPDEGCDFKNWSQAYKEVIAKNDGRDRFIAEKTQSLIDQGRLVLVLVKQLSHGERLRKLIPNSVFIAGSSPRDVVAFHTSGERERILGELRRGEIRCVIASTIADMGVDIPALDALVLAGGGKSSTRHLQRIGRTLRPSPGKTHGVIYDFDDSHAHVKTRVRQGVEERKLGWFHEHAKARRKIEEAEFGDVAIWL